MARPWRIQYEGAIYHIMSRGVGRGKIFLADDDYSKFLEYVGEKLKTGPRNYALPIFIHSKQGGDQFREATRRTGGRSVCKRWSFVW